MCSVATDPSPAAGFAALPVGATREAIAEAAYGTRAFGWMVAGLLLSTVVTFAAQSSEQLLRFAASNFSLVIARPRTPGRCQRNAAATRFLS